jgi:hypothetical protein
MRLRLIMRCSGGGASFAVLPPARALRAQTTCRNCANELIEFANVTGGSRRLTGARPAVELRRACFNASVFVLQLRKITRLENLLENSSRHEADTATLNAVVIISRHNSNPDRRRS